MAVRIEADPRLVSPDFAIEKFKTQTRIVEAVAPVVSVDPALMNEIDEADIADVEEVPEAEDAPVETAQPAPDEGEGEGGSQGKKRRRRRRRRKSRNESDMNGDSSEVRADDEVSEASEDIAAFDSREEGEAEAGSDDADASPPPEDKPRRRSRTRRKKAPVEAEVMPESREGSGAIPAGGQVPSEEAEPGPQFLKEDVLEPEGGDERAPDPAVERTEAEPAIPAGAAADATTLVPEADGRDATLVPEEVHAADDAPALERAEAPASTDREEAAEQAGADAAQPLEKTSRSKRRGWWSFGG
jgi:ribonuclease E